MTKPMATTKDNQPQWLVVSYEPVSLFSLKRSDATSMAARTDLVPTPYAIKMALLRILIETKGKRHRTDFETWIEQEFAWVRDLQIFVQPSQHLVVNRNGYKLRYWDQQADKDYRKANHKTPPPAMPLQGGFVFREWVHLAGNLQICCGPTLHIDILQNLFSQINYFGKRSCFFQFQPEQTQRVEQPCFEPDVSSGFMLQPMDDLGRKATFNRINPFSDEKAKLDRDRTILPKPLPLKLIATSARYDFYQRFDG